MKEILRKLRIIIISLIVIFLIYQEITVIYPPTKKDLDIIFNYPNTDFQWRLGFKIGYDFLKYVDFLKERIPSEAKILLPPQSFPWPKTGNSLYLTYFLYPRRLVEWTKRENETYDYILVLWGEDAPIESYQPGFPKEDVKGELTYLVDNDFNNVQSKRDYSFYNEMKPGFWGFIKLDK